MRPFAVHDVDPEVLHGRVQVLLHRRRQAMDLVDEQNRPLARIRQVGDQVLGSLQRCSGRGLDLDVHFPRQTKGKRGLAQTGRSIEQDVPQGFLPFDRRIDGDHEPFVHFALADHFPHALRPQVSIAVIAGRGRGAKQCFACHGVESLREPVGSPCLRVGSVCGRVALGRAAGTHENHACWPAVLWLCS